MIYICKKIILIVESPSLQKQLKIKNNNISNRSKSFNDRRTSQYEAKPREEHL